MSPRAVKSFVGIAAVAALAWMLWRAELVRFTDSAGMRGETDASPSSLAKDDPSSGGKASELAPASDPSREGRAELASLTGRLKVAKEDVPLGGFPITIEGGPTARADPFGEFEFQGLAPGPARLIVQAGSPFEPLEREIELTPGINSVELRLVPRFELTVAVVEKAARPGEASQPISGASVRLESASDTEAFWYRKQSWYVLGSGLTDAEGRCVLGGIPSGDFALVAEAAGHVASRVPLSCWYGDKASRARPRPIVLALSASSAVLRGRVRGPERQPQEGALVCLDTCTNKKRTFTRAIAGITMPSPPYTFTDADGVFELPLPDGALEVALLVCGRDHRFSPIARRVVSHDDFERELAIQLEAARAIEIRVQGVNVPGQVKVSDGVLSYDLISDPVLAAIPGFAELFVDSGPVHLVGTDARMSLPDGGYEVSFGNELGISGAWFIRVGAGEPTLFELRAP